MPAKGGGQKCKKIEEQKTKPRLVFCDFFHAEKKENFLGASNEKGINISFE